MGVHQTPKHSRLHHIIFIIRHVRAPSYSAPVVRGVSGFGHLLTMARRGKCAEVYVLGL
jgi:hypothetical protein